jgi:hypothetical protein
MYFVIWVADGTVWRFRHIQIYLSNLLKAMAKEANLDNEAFLTGDLHVWPDFHGNRSPIADPTLKGTVSTATNFPDPRFKQLISDLWFNSSWRRKKLGSFVPGHGPSSLSTTFLSFAQHFVQKSLF